MKAYELRGSFGLDNLLPVERETPNPSGAQVLIEISAASLNFRDLKTILGIYNPKQQLPLIPLSDGVGKVVAVGSDVKSLKVGDRVASLFSQAWMDGPPSRDLFKTTLGGPLDGMLATHALLRESGVIKVPDYLSDVEAATLPCAGVTAWNALMGFQAMRENDWVVILGSGGVGLFALQIAKWLGARVIALSSSDEKLHRLKDMGADLGINYKNEPEWSGHIREITGGEGADHVIELAGAQTLAQSIDATKPGGQVSVIGTVSGVNAQLDVRPILMKSLRVQGVFVGSKARFESLNRMLEESQIKPVIDAIYPFSQAQKAISDFKEEPHFGKVCISMQGNQ